MNTSVSRQTWFCGRGEGRKRQLFSPQVLIVQDISYKSSIDKHRRSNTHLFHSFKETFSTLATVHYSFRQIYQVRRTLVQGSYLHFVLIGGLTQEINPNLLLQELQSAVLISHNEKFQMIQSVESCDKQPHKQTNNYRSLRTFRSSEKEPTL